LDRPEDDPRSVEAERPQRVARKRVELRLRGAASLKLMTKVLQIAVDPASSGWPLEAGGTGGGKPPRMPHPGLHTPFTRGDEAEEAIQSGNRCGIFFACHLCGVLETLHAIPLRRERKSSSKTREGKSVLGASNREIHEGPDDIIPDIDRDGLESLSVQRRPANIVAKRLQSTNLISHPARGRLRQPVMKKPSHAKVIPAREDQTAPTGCPNLLEWRHIASVTSVAPTLYRGGGRRCAMALYLRR